MGAKESKIGNFLVLDLSGRLDTSNYGELEKNLLEVIERGEKNIVINCSDLHYISSSGLRVFLMALKKITGAGGRFSLCSLQDNIREIFEIAGFNTIFSIFDTVDEATK
ncbi:MAG: STAS domain-containing protein [Bacteroidales bacterium]